MQPGLEIGNSILRRTLGRLEPSADHVADRDAHDRLATDAAPQLDAARALGEPWHILSK